MVASMCHRDKEEVDAVILASGLQKQAGVMPQSVLATPAVLSCELRMMMESPTTALLGPAAPPYGEARPRQTPDLTQPVCSASRPDLSTAHILTP